MRMWTLCIAIVVMVAPKLVCTASFDNSEGNPANPDPSDTVKFGPQTWHEMMIGWYATLSAEDDGYAAVGPEAAARAEAGEESQAGGESE